jgi:hypothetical protein
MTPFEPSATTAAVFSAVWVALVAGHWIGDHAVSSDADAVGKGQPDDEQLAAGVHPWTGWAPLARHVIAYVACQAVALGMICTVAPVSIAGAAGALVVSGSTHAVIDRRWIVRAIIRAKRCAGWADGPYLIDQSLHYAALLIAAVVAALITTAPSAAAPTVVVTVLGVAVVAGGLAVEKRRGTALRQAGAAR